MKLLTGTIPRPLWLAAAAFLSASLGQLWATDIIDLGRAPAHYTFEGGGLNNAGQAYLNVYTATPGPSFNSYETFFYSGGRLSNIGNLGGYSLYTSDINDNGQLVGDAYFPNRQTPFLYSGGTIHPISAPNFDSAVALNNRGDILGLHLVPTGGEFYQTIVAVYSAEGVTLLPSPPNSGQDSLEPVAIGYNGDVVVNLIDPYYSGAFTYAYIFKDGQFVFLPSNTCFTCRQHLISQAVAMNSKGLIVYNSEPYPPACGDSCSAVFVYSNGQQVPIITPPAAHDSYAISINDLGQVLGIYGSDSGNVPFLYGPNRIFIDVNSLLPVSSGWDIQTLYEINNAGQILGLGTFEGEPHAFILNTTPEPKAWELAGIGLVLAGVIGRRFALRKGA